GYAAHISFEEGKRVHAGIQFDGGNRMAYIDGVNHALLIAHMFEAGAVRRWDKDSDLNLANQLDYDLAVLLTGDGFAVSVDGVERYRAAAKGVTMSDLALQVSHGPASFDRVRIRRKE
ncbi:MAG: hypothetical protein JO332_10795, partial [Planctomycetaceae bacterium]|nr:hypothetical protein [Planctomycetaceae bacterium]